MNSAPAPSVPCPEGDVNMASAPFVCAKTQGPDVTGVLLVGAGAKYEVGAVGSYVEQFSGSYVPYRGFIQIECNFAKQM